MLSAANHDYIHYGMCCVLMQFKACQLQLSNLAVTCVNFTLHSKAVLYTLICRDNDHGLNFCLHESRQSKNSNPKIETAIFFWWSDFFILKCSKLTFSPPAVKTQWVSQCQAFQRLVKSSHTLVNKTFDLLNRFSISLAIFDNIECFLRLFAI
jgi:hypothetical protein